MFGIRTKTPPKAPAEVAGVRVRPSTRARRMALSVDPRRGDVVLVWPRGTSEKRAIIFVEENRKWIEKHARAAAGTQVFVPGGRIPFQGGEVEIVHAEGRGVTRLEAGQLIVHGRVEHLPRRIRDFLKAEATRVLLQAATEKLAAIGRKPATRLRVIDPRTRWGSCNTDGTIMFSWRLILMPPAVLDYVVAHEVAHCIHMNHSRKFWKLCASLTQDASAARRWLRLHGTDVMAYR